MMFIQIVCVTLLLCISCLAAPISFLPNFLKPARFTGNTNLFVGDDLNLTCRPKEENLKNFTVNNISFSFFKPFEVISGSGLCGGFTPDLVPKSHLYRNCIAELSFPFTCAGTEYVDSEDLCLPGSEAECLPVSLVHVNADQQSAALVVRNVTVGAAGQYTCHIGRKHCLERKDPSELETVGSVDVVVEYPPQNVSQFVCVFYNWNDFANCTWQHPVKYVNWSNINISAAYTVSLKHDRVSAFRCPQLTADGCRFNSSEFFLVKNYVLEVNVTNISRNITASKVFVVDTSKAVKPAPVINLSSESTPGCIALSWNHSKSYEKIYRVRHQIVGDSDFEVVDDSFRYTHFNVCGYPSYTHHKFVVDCYPAGAYSGNWSDTVDIQESTPMTAPNVGPTTVNGCYTSAKCVNGSRNVTLMWQDVKESDRNGIIDGYHIKLGEKYLKDVSSDAHLTVVELLCDSPSELTIFAHNKGGYSVKPSVMVISPETFAVPASIIESFAVEISAKSGSELKESLRAVWNMTEDREHLNYIIFWCLGLPGGTCEGLINWSEVPGSRMDYDFPVLDAEAQKYLFGISMRDFQTGRASGIFWTGCLFRHLGPSARVKSVDNMHVENGTEYVLVAWNPLQCSYQNQLKVSSYIVKWCEASRCNDNEVFSVSVPASESSYTVSPLTANVNYKFTVQPMADGQAGDEVQPWIVAKPYAAAGQKYLWILVVLLVPVVLLAVYIYWKCSSGRKNVHKLVHKPIIEIPDNLNDSPQVSPATSEDHFMHAASDVAATQPQANSESAMIIYDEQIPDQATSEDSSANDTSVNSRTHLITKKSQKESQQQHLPQVPDCIALEGICEHDDGTSALEGSSQEFDHADVQNSLPAEQDSSNNGWSPASLNTGTNSVPPYVQFTELPAVHKNIPVQDDPHTHIPAQIKPHSDECVLCVKPSHEKAGIAESNIDDYLHMAEDGEIQERQNPDDTVTNVEPTAPSVIGAQSGGVHLGQCDNETTFSGITDSDFSWDFQPSSRSGHVSSHSSSGRPPGGGDYVRHKYV